MVLAILAILFCVVYTLKLDSNPKIVQTTPNGTLFLQNINTYERAANTLFKNSVLNLNKITINSSGIAKSLKQQFPELADVSIALPLIGHRPVVYITPSQPALVLSNSSGKFVLGSNGIALLKGDLPSSLQGQLPVVDDQTDSQIVLGKTALSSRSTQFIEDVYKQLITQKQKVGTLSLPPKANELDVGLKGQQYYVKMDISGDAREQVGTYLATKKYLARTNATPTVYIDVRVNGRAYYK